MNPSDASEAWRCRTARWSRAFICASASVIALVASATELEPGPWAVPEEFSSDDSALWLAMRYLRGGDEAREALGEAVRRMGWSVRDAQGRVIQSAPAGADTRLALWDYEMEELLWNPAEQPAVRLIATAQAMAVPLEGLDPEELAQGLLEAVREAAAARQPQQRFWGQFIIALGRASADGYDLGGPGAPRTMSADPGEEARLQRQIAAVSQRLAQRQANETNPMRLMRSAEFQELTRLQEEFARAAAPIPVWPDDDPVLAPSARPDRVASTGASPRDTATRDQLRLDEIPAELNLVLERMVAHPGEFAVLQERVEQLQAEMGRIAARMQAAALAEMARPVAPAAREEEDEDADEADDEDESPPSAAGHRSDRRFLAEHREAPLSLLQVTLIARVFAADLRLPDPLAPAPPPPRVVAWRAAGNPWRPFGGGGDVDGSSGPAHRRPADRLRRAVRRGFW
jgi:hypothetical protein